MSLNMKDKKKGFENKQWRNTLCLNSTQKIKIKGKQSWNCRASNFYTYMYIYFDQRTQCLPAFNGTFVRREEQGSVLPQLCALSAISSPQILLWTGAGRRPPQPRGDSRAAAPSHALQMAPIQQGTAGMLHRCSHIHTACSSHPQRALKHGPLLGI